MGTNLSPEVEKWVGKGDHRSDKKNHCSSALIARHYALYSFTEIYICSLLTGGKICHSALESAVG